MEETRSKYTNHDFAKSETKDSKNVNYEFETSREQG